MGLRKTVGRFCFRIDGVVPMLTLSLNTKTGVSLNVAPIHSCPGATNACKSVCFGLDGRFQPGMNGAVVTERNWAALQRNPRLLLTLPMPGPTIAVRLFGVGDVWSVDAARTVFDLVEMHSDREFWQYTRSRFEFGVAMAERRDRGQPPIPSNLVLFASTDWENHRDAKRWAAKWGLPIAYMVFTGHGVVGEMDEDFGWRGAFHCPVENPAVKDKWPLTKRRGDSPCQRCRYCIDGKPGFAEYRAGRGVRFDVHLSPFHPLAERRGG